LIKNKNIYIKHFLLFLFIGYYVNSTFFYHSHIIDGVRIVHSHFYWPNKNSKDKPVKHTHTRDEFFTINIISNFSTTPLSGTAALTITLILLYQLLIPLKTKIQEGVTFFNYSLRAPPAL